MDTTMVMKTTGSAIFATLCPISDDATRALTLHQNRNHLVLRNDLSEPSHITHNVTNVVKLDFDGLFGRSCFTIGSSRANDIQLCRKNICPQHFILCIDVDTRLFYIKDTSTRGIWISQSATTADGFTPYHQSTVAVTSAILVRLGDRGRFGFVLNVMEANINGDGSLDEHLALYANSVGSNHLDRKRRASHTVYESDAPPPKRRKLTVEPSTSPTTWENWSQ